MTALVAVAVTTAIMWLALLLAIFVGSRENAGEDGGKKGGGFVRDTVTRFMGLIVVAMGVQFALNGLQSFFKGSGAG